MILSSLIIGCKHNKEIAKTMTSTSKAFSHTIVYKTISDFSDYVPVILNDERTKIISYPAPTDVFYNGKLAKPTSLKNGYLLDNRGITEYVAFLKYTYEDYSRLKEAPSLNEMYNNILEKYPLKEFIYCGSRNRFKDEVNDLNALIEAGFPNCEKATIVPMKVYL